MDQEKLINELKELGFNEYKAKVFLSLSKGKPMTASEIAKDAKIVRGSIYDILKDFVEKGYCNEIETNRILQFQIIDPDVIVDKIERDYKSNFNRKVTHLKETFSKVKAIYNPEYSDEKKFIHIELIRGFNKHRVSKYREFLMKAQKEICGIYQLKGIISDDSDMVANEFIQKGGTIRSIYGYMLDFKIIRNGEVIDATKDDLIKVCKNFERMGEEVRISLLNLPNMTIVDRENVFINTNDKWIPQQNQADIILRRSEFAKNMHDLFNYYWNDSYTINEFEKLENISIK
jgi:predicted transcriptional regulator